MAWIDSTTAGANNTIPIVPVPAGTAIDDIVILVVTSESGAMSGFAGLWPSGFTQLDDKVLLTDGETTGIAWKRLTAADTGNYTLSDMTANGCDFNGWTGHAHLFRGRNTTNPPVIGTVGTASGVGTPQSATANGVTAVEGDDLLYAAIGDLVLGSGTSSFTQPTGFTVRENSQSPTASVLDRLYGATKDNQSAGATGSITSTLSWTSLNGAWAAWLIRIPAGESTAATRIPFRGSFGRRRTRYAL